MPTSSGIRRSKPRCIGLALGGGAARGWAHVGVLEALDAAGIVPQCIAGTSIGALVGAVHASGGIDGVRSLVESIDWRRMLSLVDPVLPRTGLIDGRRLEELVRAHVRESRIEDLPIPFRAVATDLTHASEVVFDQGDVAEAVRASVSVPGLFTPVRLEDRTLVDGGLLNPVPVSVARKMGADFVIAVDINPSVEGERPYSPENLLGVLISTVALTEVATTRMRLAEEPPDVLIRPAVGHIKFLDFTRAKEAVQAGHDAARAVLAPLTARGGPLHTAVSHRAPDAA